MPPPRLGKSRGRLGHSESGAGGRERGMKIDQKPEALAHQWTGCQQGGNPTEAGSYEWIRYCSVCGMEDTCEDPLPPCPGEAAPVGGIKT